MPGHPFRYRRDYMQPLLRKAREADVEAIASLVNRAYRPTGQEHGWTHESDLVAGRRISAPQLLAMLTPRSEVLILEMDARIVACAHVKASSSDACIGMLATEPELQAQGLGSRMLRCAEQYAATQFQATAFLMSVVSQRPELLAFYARRGYVRTGGALPYPVGTDVGAPRVAGLALIALRKDAADAPHTDVGCQSD